jgi:ubiquinone/menaquinone biosynthesis C-methylase UbiE
MKGLNQRISEQEEFYNNKEEAKTFIETSKKSWLLNLFEKSFIKYILKRYEKFDNINVLDLGCGPGYITTALAKAHPDWKITAVDYSHYMLEFAKKNAEKNKVNIKFINSKAENINLKPNQFDLIISHYSFSEFENAEKVLKNIIKVAKNNAYFEIVDVLRTKNQLYTNIITKISRLFYGKKFNQQYINSLKGAYSIEELKALFNLPEFKQVRFKFNILPRISSNIYISGKIIK